MENEKDKVEQMILIKGIQQYRINKKIIQFCQLLEFCYEDEENTNKGNTFTFNVPEQLSIDNSIINVIEKFMTAFDYNPDKIKLRKVEAYFFKKDPECIQEMKKFIEENLTPMGNETLKQIISFCRYFQIKSLLEVIYFHLADKYTLSYSTKLAEEQLEKYKIKKMTDEEITELKLQYFDYFQKLSTQYKDIKEEKEKAKEEVKNREKNNKQGQTN